MSSYLPPEAGFESPVVYEVTEAEIDLYEKGLKLRRLVNTPEWELVLQVHQDYLTNVIDALTDLAPGDPVVPTAHAAASAIKDFVKKFEQDTNNAVDYAANPPENLVAYLRGEIKARDVLRAQETK